MKISTKGRYGLRVMLDLALNSEAGAVALRDIAQRQDLSEKYLWQVINPLKAAGLVNSVRGAHGGYMLARPLEQITLRDIVSVLEGAISLVDCVETLDTCARSTDCVTREAWEEVSKALSESLRKITLADLVRKARERARGRADYMI